MLVLSVVVRVVVCVVVCVVVFVVFVVVCVVVCVVVRVVVCVVVCVVSMPRGLVSITMVNVEPTDIDKVVCSSSLVVPFAILVTLSSITSMFSLSAYDTPRYPDAARIISIRRSNASRITISITRALIPLGIALVFPWLGLDSCIVNQSR